MYRFLLQFKQGRKFVASRLAKSEDPVENLTAMYLRGELEVTRNDWKSYILVLPDGSEIMVDIRGYGRGRNPTIVIDGGMGDDGFVVKDRANEISPVSFFWKLLSSDGAAKYHQERDLELSQQIAEQREAMRKRLKT